jgi:hypothetical protein
MHNETQNQLQLVYKAEGVAEGAAEGEGRVGKKEVGFEQKWVEEHDERTAMTHSLPTRIPSI